MYLATDSLTMTSKSRSSKNLAVDILSDDAKSVIGLLTDLASRDSYALTMFSISLFIYSLLQSVFTAWDHSEDGMNMWMKITPHFSNWLFLFLYAVHHIVSQYRLMKKHEGSVASLSGKGLSWFADVNDILLAWSRCSGVLVLLGIYIVSVLVWADVRYMHNLYIALMIMFFSVTLLVYSLRVHRGKDAHRKDNKQE